MEPFSTIDGATLMSQPLRPRPLWWMVWWPRDCISWPQGGEVLAGPVAGGDRDQGGGGLGVAHPAGHHPLPLPGGLHAPHPKPPV